MNTLLSINFTVPLYGGYYSVYIQLITEANTLHNTRK